MYLLLFLINLIMFKFNKELANFKSLSQVHNYNCIYFWIHNENITLGRRKTLWEMFLAAESVERGFTQNHNSREELKAEGSSLLSGGHHHIK